MSGISRVGDHSDHVYNGQHGIIIGPCSPSTFADGIAVARIGDKHSCPIPNHGVTALVSSPATHVDVDGNVIVVIGAKAQCGATIIEGSPSSSAV